MKVSTILSFPAGYRLFQWMVGAESARKTYLAEYVKPAPKHKILDIGCGPADILNYLPAVNYTGLDISPEYISSAKERFGSRGCFYCGDMGLATIEGERGSFDLVLAIGVVHHLDDTQASKLFALARRVLRPTGSLITYDGCYVPQQSQIARWLLGNDRGKFVRTREEYLRLASAHFSKVEPHIRHDLLRIPYTHLIMRCSD
ncbi:MAG TPA: class I SAM-dependent methyltransferase [Verrucomicrobiae bacterium]|jgi:cyclopropane fatty-acyl-phospholipid synthase-like methyltransferase|nr:class I SAM-dependent methyltransferase [Verrucomicrobiae bacterium]